MNNNADLRKSELNGLVEGKLAAISDMQLRSKRLKERFKKTENCKNSTGRNLSMQSVIKATTRKIY